MAEAQRTNTFDDLTIRNAYELGMEEAREGTTEFRSPRRIMRAVGFYGTISDLRAEDFSYREVERLVASYDAGAAYYHRVMDK